MTKFLIPNDTVISFPVYFGNRCTLCPFHQDHRMPESFEFRCMLKPNKVYKRYSNRQRTCRLIEKNLKGPHNEHGI